MVDRPTPAWADDPDAVAPTILVLGGFLTSPPLYRRFRRRLLERGAADVVVADIWLHEWLLAGGLGMRRIVARSARDLDQAAAIAGGHRVSRGAPLLVVGHSAGGVVARLLTAQAPFGGQGPALAEAMGALVTLGSPHHVGRSRYAGRRIGDVAAHVADRHVPGSAFAPRVGYVSVASRSVVGRRRGTGRERVAWRTYRGLLGDAGPDGVDGDGVVPVASALLDGSTQIVLDGVAHGQGSGRPWYGAEPAIDAWWPAALEAWHEALRVRASAADATASAVSRRTGRP
jgi:hypothetical protein